MSKVDRRKLLGGIVSAGAIVGLTGAAAPAHAADGPAGNGEIPEGLLDLARLRSYKARRSSSWDRSGGNGDSVPVPAGKSVTLLDVTGAGVITHVWFTINSPDPNHLKNLVLRMWWDGESTPSVEAPIGDFYGLTLGEYFTYQSALTAVAPVKALNCYFEMPFSSAAKITVTNEGKAAHAQSLLRGGLCDARVAARGCGAVPCAVPAGRAGEGLDQRLEE